MYPSNSLGLKHELDLIWDRKKYNVSLRLKIFSTSTNHLITRVISFSTSTNHLMNNFIG